MKPARLIPHKGLTSTQRKSLGLMDGFVKREREQNEALPRTISWRELEPLDVNTLKLDAVRPGADDHKQYKSRGL